MFPGYIFNAIHVTFFSILWTVCALDLRAVRADEVVVRRRQLVCLTRQQLAL